MKTRTWLIGTLLALAALAFASLVWGRAAAAANHATPHDAVIIQSLPAA